MDLYHEKHLKTNIWKLYLFKTFTGLTFFLPIIVLFWQKNGLSLTQIMLLQSLYSISIVLLEIPTGYFADIFGRKISLTFASFFLTLGILIYSFGSNFYHFLMAEILIATGVALTSGTISALIFDTLQNLKQENLYKKVIGNTLFFYLIAISIASIIGGVLGKINFRFTFYAMLPFMFLLIPLSASLKEPKRKKRIIKKGYLKQLLQILKISLVKNKKLRWLIIYAAVILGFNNTALWLYQPYFKLTGLNIAYFGIVFASFNLISALSSKYAHNIEKTLGQKYSLISLALLVSLSYILMGNFIYLFSFTFAFIQQFVKGFSRPIITDYINKLTTSDIRATVLSAQNLAERLFYSAIIPIIGWIADVYTLTQALILTGIATFTSGTIILFILYKDKVI